MVLKADWEKANEYTSIDEQTVYAMIAGALPNATLSSYNIIAGGCANLNIKLEFKGSEEPLILRVYLRDQDAAAREQQIYQLIGANIPVPEIIYVGNIHDYKYALIKYVAGITLQEAILADNEDDISDAIYEAGKILAELQNYKFPISGFFDSSLNITAKLARNNYIDFLKGCLQSPICVQQLGNNIITRITKITNQHQHLLPDGSEPSLVHADYDPSNMLVHKQDGVWKIAAILDWEFAFSGSYLCDVANMLRYAHKLPASYEQAFLSSIKDAGINLPDDWRITIHLLNLISLLDCLNRSDPQNSPQQCKDIKGLIGYILQTLESFNL